MADSKQILFEHVIETAQHAPIHKRAQLYRALAEYAGDRAQSETLLEMAADLEMADLKCRELGFRFQQEFARKEPNKKGTRP